MTSWKLNSGPYTWTESISDYWPTSPTPAHAIIDRPYSVCVCIQYFLTTYLYTVCIYNIYIYRYVYTYMMADI